MSKFMGMSTEKTRRYLHGELLESGVQKIGSVSLW